MTEKEFLNGIANGQEDILQKFIDLIDQLKINYCVIGGLGVNAYVEPVVSLDLDIIVAIDRLDQLKETFLKDFTIQEFEHSVKLSTTKSRLRIKLQTDPRYQSFLKGSVNKNILGYEMKVATLEDILKGKIWACQDNKRRQSKRQKDLADIARIIEAYPHCLQSIPEPIRLKLV